MTHSPPPWTLQFSALHTRGSSHGGSRITRRAYTKPYYIKMMVEAYRMWDQIEREGNTQLYMWVCGGMHCCGIDYPLCAVMLVCSCLVLRVAIAFKMPSDVLLIVVHHTIVCQLNKCVPLRLCILLYSILLLFYLCVQISL